MNKALLLLGAALFAGHFATAALADDKAMGHDEMATMGKHDMTGTVETIDHKTGMMKVKTGVGPLDVHFPPPAIKDLKPGDSITLHLGYTKEGGMKK